MARGSFIAILSLLLLTSVAMGGSLAQWRAQWAIAGQANDPDAVIELTRRIVAADPHATDAWTALVQARIKTEDYGRALASLAAWEKVAKRTAAIDDLRGDIYLAQDQPAGAERAWRASLATKPNNYAVLSKLADLLETHGGRPQEILALRTRAVAAKPAAALLAALADARLELHDWNGAMAAIRKANKLDATDPTVQKWLPGLELLEKSIPRLAALDAQVARGGSASLEALLDQGALLAGLGQPALALGDAGNALRLDPGSVRALIQAGEAELDLGKPDAAAKFKVSHDLKRGSDGHVTAEALGELGLRDDAVRKNPGQAGPLAARSKTLRDLNQYVLALEDARAALRLDRNSPEAEFEMGHDLDGLGRPGEALPHIVRATELRPGDAVAWYYRGVIEANRADFTAAIASQTRSLAIRESVVALKARIDCELRLALASQAAADLDRLHQLDPTSTE